MENSEHDRRTGEPEQVPTREAPIGDQPESVQHMDQQQAGEEPNGGAPAEHQDAMCAAPDSGGDSPSGFTSFRRITSHPIYRKTAPWLSLLRRLAPAIGVLTFLVAGSSAVISLVNLLQNRDLYLRSLRPVLTVELSTPTKDKPRQFVFGNPSGADAHEVHIGCRRLPAWTSMYADIPIAPQPSALEIARNTSGFQMPIDTNCPRFDAGPEPPGTMDADTTVLPLLVCYLDERNQPHALVRLFSYTAKGSGFNIMPIGSVLGKHIAEDASQQCHVAPQSS